MYKIGVDLGGTNISAGIIDKNYKIIGKAKIKTNLPRSSDKILLDIIKLVNIALKNSNISINEVYSVGVGTPGAVNMENGIVELSSNLGFNNVLVKNKLEKSLQKPVFVANDANCAALAEKILGAGKNSKDFVAITLGTGIGGGFFFDNKMLTGVNGIAGEVGHMVINLDGIECRCNRQGCWEKYASATALIQQTKDALLQDKEKDSYIWTLIHNDTSKIDGKTVFDAMRNSDKLGTKVVKKYIDYLACGITNIINIFQPQVLCIGGGISNEGDTLLIPLVERVERARYATNLNKQTKICIAELKNDAGIIGASLLNNI